MRHAKRVDRNHAEIRDALRKCGYDVLDLSACGGGVPDLCVKIPGGIALFLEIKDGEKPPSAQALTEAEAEWFQFNEGNTRKVNSLNQALAEISLFRVRRLLDNP